MKNLELTGEEGRKLLKWIYFEETGRDLEENPLDINAPLAAVILEARDAVLNTVMTNFIGQCKLSSIQQDALSAVIQKESHPALRRTHSKITRTNLPGKGVTAILNYVQRAIKEQTERAAS